VSTAAPGEAQAAVVERGGIARVAAGYWGRVKAGDVGSLPVILALVLIVAFFTSKTTVFFTADNFNNLMPQMAGTAVIAIGVVFVLLIGEIDLSIGSVSGIGGVAVAEFQQAGTGHNFGGATAIVLAIAAGALIGALQGSFVALIGVPSFVVTLAGLLAFEGVILKALGIQGVIGIQSNLVNNVANYSLPKGTGWVVAAVVVAGYAAVVAAGHYRRRRHGLPTRNLLLAALKLLALAAIAFGVVAIANNPRVHPGVPFAGILVVGLVIVMGYVATRTTFGRHVYAVGGNAEAARRAGINVARIRILVFMISGAFAALGGVVFASRLNSVDLTAGSGTVLLDAISAAVIGGTSLFGGRGYVRSALLGALVIKTVENGLDLIGETDWVKDVTTGVILLAAVTLDTISKRRLQASGR
jgi:D-xylose transport system permease protein